MLTRLALCSVFVLMVALPMLARAASETISLEKFGLQGHGKRGSLYCKEHGDGRKPVWLNTVKATYALNGAAISWVQRTNALGVP
ncbi:MAG: hypothetical protein OEO83_12240, partial [Alphaproteobacteria bacterium]|nr:hypothetical protein [Alphaproteobacteria bacterium]